MSSFSAQGQTGSAEAQLPTAPPWAVGFAADGTDIGRGLPVLALDRADWPNYRSDAVTTARAVRSLYAEVTATHPSGWRFGPLARAEAWLEANSDAVEAAALQASQTDPGAPANFLLNARSQTWQGLGIKMGTPWWNLGTEKRWQWQADVQLLQLRQLRTAEISGEINYTGASAYDFNLQSERSKETITGPYLPPSDRTGLGASLSLALKGNLAPGWWVQVRADDLFSQLHWQNLATDTNVLNSQVTSRAADGSLDYAPLLKGQLALLPVTRRIGAHWQAQVNWALTESWRLPGAATFRADHKAGIGQYWLGWESDATGKVNPYWHLELEPAFRAASVGMVWGNWRASMATDGKGMSSALRTWRVSWNAAL